MGVLRGLCAALVAVTSVTVGSAATLADVGAASDSGGQSISVTVPRLVFAAPPWLPVRLFVIEYTDATELAADGVDECSVAAGFGDQGCLVPRADGTVWHVVLVSTAG